MKREHDLIIKLVAPTLIFLVLIFVIYYQLLEFYKGYLGFGNFFYPLSPSTHDYIFWDPYYENGAANFTPLSFILGDFVFNFFYYGVGFIIGATVSVKLYILFETFLFFVAFYILTSEFTSNIKYRIAATIFYTLNPVQLVILAHGNWSNMQAYSTFFLGYVIILKVAKRKITEFYMLAAYLLLMFSFLDFQVFYLGIFIYLISAVIIRFNEDYLKPHKYKQLVSFLSKNIIFEGAISLPVLLPLIFSAFVNVSPTGNYAQPIAAFYNGSTYPSILLFLEGGGKLAWTSVGSFGSLFANIWSYSLYLLISGSIFLSSFLMIKQKKMNFALPLLLISIGVLIGSETKGPLGLVAVYLYLHFPGYQVLNYSYIWDQIVISFSFSLIVLSLIDYFGRKKDLRQKLFIKKISRDTLNKSVAVSLITLMLFVSLTPIVTQNYYNVPLGINDRSSIYNSNYSSLCKNISELVKNTDFGVMFFPENPGVFYDNNSSYTTTNPLVLYPNYRTPIIGNYNEAISPSENYFIWLYSTFFSNRTKYLAELSAIDGVKYFVVFKHLYSSAFGNPGPKQTIADLLEQRSLKILTSTPNYDLFENELNISSVYRVTNLTLVIGNMSLLNYMAYAGFNLNNLSILFQSDLSAHNWNTLVPKIRNIVVENYSAIYNFVRKINGFNQYTVNKLYSHLVHELNNGEINLTEIFPPSSIFLSNYDISIGDSCSNQRDGKVYSSYPNGTMLHLQSSGSNLTKFTLYTGLKGGRILIQAAEIAGGCFFVNNLSNSFGFHPASDINELGWLQAPQSFINRQNLTFFLKGYVFLGEIVYTTNNNLFGNLKRINNLTVSPESHIINNVSVTSSVLGETVSGDFLIRNSTYGNYVFELKTNLGLKENSSISFLLHESGPVFVFLSGAIFSGTSNNTYYVISTSLLTTHSQNLSDLVILFYPLRSFNNTNITVNFTITFLGVYSYGSPSFSIVGDTGCNDDVSNNLIGYDLNVKKSGMYLFFIPYYKEVESNGGLLFSSLGGMVSIALLNNNSKILKVIVNSYSSLIDSILISILIWSCILLVQIICSTRIKRLSTKHKK